MSEYSSFTAGELEALAEADKTIRDDAIEMLKRAKAKDWVDDFRRKQAYSKKEPVDIANVKPRRTEWLIPNYVPLGHLTLGAGEEGIGKGLMATWIAAQVMREGRNVLFMSTEDDEEEVRLRLDSLGWKPTKQGGKLYHLDSPVSMEALRTYVTERNVSLVILDALRDFMPITPGVGRSNNDDSYVRPALLAVRRFAKDMGVAVFGLHHTNKATHDNGRPRTPREMIGGAAAFQQVPRHVLYLARRVDKARAFCILKSNIHSVGWVSEYDTVEVGEYGVRFMPAVDVADRTTTMVEWLESALDIKIERDDDEILDIVRKASLDLSEAGYLPTRDVLCARVKAQDVTQAQVKAALATLQSDGEVVKKGRHLAWSTLGSAFSDHV